MKILFITNRFPVPPNRGDRVRTYNIARVLSLRHDLTLVSFVDEPIESSNMREARGIFKEMHLIKTKPLVAALQTLCSLPTMMPLQVSYYASNEFETVINNLPTYDLSYTFHLRLAPYGVLSDAKYKILDMTDAVSGFMLNLYKHGPLWHKPIGYIEHARTRSYENNVAVKFNESWVVSAVEKETLVNSGCPGTINIIPNGVNEALLSFEKRYLQGNNIVFVGYMGVESVDAAEVFL